MAAHLDRVLARTATYTAAAAATGAAIALPCILPLIPLIPLIPHDEAAYAHDSFIALGHAPNRRPPASIARGLEGRPEFIGDAKCMTVAGLALGGFYR